MEATLASFWVSPPARAGPEPRSWPRLTSTIFSQVSSPRVQNMNQGKGRKHSEHSPETTRSETPVAEAAEREGRRERQAPVCFRSHREQWVVHSAGTKGWEEMPRRKATLDWHKADHNKNGPSVPAPSVPRHSLGPQLSEMTFPLLLCQEKNRNESLAVQRPSEIVCLITA